MNIWQTICYFLYCKILGSWVHGKICYFTVLSTFHRVHQEGSFRAKKFVKKFSLFSFARVEILCSSRSSFYERIAITSPFLILLVEYTTWLWLTTGYKSGSNFSERPIYLNSVSHLFCLSLHTEMVRYRPTAKLE